MWLAKLAPVLLALLLTLPLSAAPCSPVLPMKSAALLIGIPALGPAESHLSVGEAKEDIQAVRARLKQLAPGMQIFELGSDATTSAVNDCLKALAKTESGGTNVIFISARGFSRQRLAEGYILTSLSDLAKLENRDSSNGNALSLTEFQTRLAAMNRANTFVFLDLLRQPVERPGVENLIYSRILQETFISQAQTRRIVLASEPKQPSVNGVYAKSIGSALNRAQSLDAFFQKLKEAIARAAPQKPNRPPAKPRDGWDRYILSESRWRSGPLLASLLPAFFLRALSPEAAEDDPDAARTAAALTAESEGQRVFVRYGEGNHFAGSAVNACDDSGHAAAGERLCAPEYREAAKAFERAAHLREEMQPPVDDALVASLRRRASFCRAQAALLDGKRQEALRELQPGKVTLPEAHNVLGIAYLEGGDYAKAREQFIQASEKAPLWAYPRHNLALTYAEQGAYGAAEREYREAIAVAPVGVRVRSERDNPCFHGKEVMVVTRPYLYYNLAILLHRLNRLPEAQRQLCLAAESFRAQQNLLNQPDQLPNTGAPLLALQVKQNLADTYNSIGVVLTARRKREARSWIERAAREGSEEARKNLEAQPR